MASLGPLSSEVFAEKVLSAQATSSAAAAKASFERSCTACQKTYYSENAYQNHLGSQKHRARVTSIQNGEAPAMDDETSSVMSSTISLGEPIGKIATVTQDLEAEAEFSTVINGIKKTSLEDQEPVSRRPSRPHHSSNEERAEHPLSTTTTATSTSATDNTEEPTEDMPMLQCLFCNYKSPTLKLNILHMTKFHGMFIPEQPYLVDIEGLIGYLQAKIAENNECLFCHKLKNSIGGIQTHMRDKGHCMIAFESEEEMIEIGQFYDFRSTYSDEEDDGDTDMDESKPVISGGVKLGSRRSETQTVVDDQGDSEMADGGENADGWETDSSASLDSEDLHALPIDHDHAFDRLQMHRHHSHTDPRRHRTVDGFHSHAHSHHAAFHSDYELHLPSGRTAGHRSLSRYYRQNLHNYPTPNERIERRLLADGSADEEMLDEGTPPGRLIVTRADGGLGMLGVSDAKKREVKAVEKRDRKAVQRAQNQYQWGIDKRGNSQKHFRDPLLQ